MRRTGLRIVTQLDEAEDELDDVHCQLCRFREFIETPCYHHKRTKPLSLLPALNWECVSVKSSPPSSPISFSGSFRHSSLPAYSNYSLPSPTAIAADHESPLSPTSTDSDSDSTTSYQNRSLRHKRSPTTVTLREIWTRQSQESLLTSVQSMDEQSLLRSMQSDEQLQLLYESQIMAYLMSPLSELSDFAK